MNREDWLTQLTDSMRGMYLEQGERVPEKIRLTCGFPSKKAFASKNRVIGECWQAAASKDGTVEIFVSPCVADGPKVAAVLAHELVHACGKNGHRANFKKLAVGIGLDGPMRATVAGPKLTERLNALIEPLGPYPHAELDRTLGPQKKDGTRLLKVLCPVCGYVVRVAKKWIETGLPVCPCGEDMVQDGAKEDPEDDAN